jgi:hypothetical protein
MDGAWHDRFAAISLGPDPWAPVSASQASSALGGDGTGWAAAPWGAAPRAAAAGGPRGAPRYGPPLGPPSPWHPGMSTHVVGGQPPPSADDLAAATAAAPPGPLPPRLLAAAACLDSRGLAALIKELARAGSPARAAEVFDALRAAARGPRAPGAATAPRPRPPDVYVYTAAISACLPSRDVNRALELAAAMRGDGVAANVHTYTALMNVW